MLLYNLYKLRIRKNELVINKILIPGVPFINPVQVYSGDNIIAVNDLVFPGGSLSLYAKEKIIIPKALNLVYYREVILMQK
jgi:hypothetical protein